MRWLMGHMMFSSWHQVSQGPDTRCLVLKVPLCCRFDTETFQLFTGISKFHVTRWVDKSWQEAGSLLLCGFQHFQMSLFLHFLLFDC